LLLLYIDIWSVTAERRKTSRKVRSKLNKALPNQRFRKSIGKLHEGARHDHAGRV